MEQMSRGISLEKTVSEKLNGERNTEFDLCIILAMSYAQFKNIRLIVPGFQLYLYLNLSQELIK